MQTAAPNVARFDHEPVNGQLRGLLLEGTRSNLVPSSTVFSASARCSVTASSRAAPDGVTIARKIAEDSTAGATHYSAQYLNVPAGQTYAHSVYAAPDGRTQCGLMFIGANAYAANPYAVFDLTTGTVLNTTRSITASAQKCANGFCRVQAIATTANADTAAGFLLMPAKDGKVAYDGDGRSGIDVFGRQVEQFGFPSSYVPTSGASATRAADLTTTTDLSWLTASEGTIVVDAAFVGVLGGGMFAVSLDDGTNNGIGIYKVNGNGTIAAFSGGAESSSLGSVKDRERFRAGIGWSARGASASASLDGARSITIAQTAAVNPVALSLGSGRGGAFASSIWIRSLQYWPRRLSDAELSDATTLT
ncbi:hypothetical protein AWB76_03917 [Caballeronia temeraria]|uniref:Uncharacterized protein n=2 Tax=Caballeronia temeraria TaxID=1777137 RepID=A0A158BAW5_9BURK|nr:hypothetical protein AWB76_03917 [Caballeronia temeraria]